MILTQPDARRALRSIVQSVVALVLVGLLWWIVDLLANRPGELLSIAHGVLAILMIGTVGYIMENGIRAVRLKGWGGEASFDGDGAPAAAQAAAAAAQATADQISEEAK